jgi:hypothetical protein
VEEAVNKLKNGKTSGEDGITNEMLKRGGPAVVEWLVRCYGAFIGKYRYSTNISLACSKTAQQLLATRKFQPRTIKLSLTPYHYT